MMWRKPVGAAVVSMLVLGPALLTTSFESSAIGLSDAASDGIDEVAPEMSALAPAAVDADLPERTTIQPPPSVDAGSIMDVAPSAPGTRAPPGSRSRAAV